MPCKQKTFVLTVDSFIETAIMHLRQPMHQSAARTYVFHLQGINAKLTIVLQFADGAELVIPWYQYCIHM